MKKIIIAIAFLALAAGLASAQDDRPFKRLENNFMLGGGLFLESGSWSGGNNPGLVLRVSYGLDVRLDDRWSVMPGAGLRDQLGDIRHYMWVGGDPDGMSMADFFVIGRCHFESEGDRIVVGFGPSVSYMVSKDTYYVDADPMDPLNGKEKFNRFDLAVQPSVMFLHGKHFQWGLEGSVGLLNAMRQYPEYRRTGSIRLHYLALTCGWHF